MTFNNSKVTFLAWHNLKDRAQIFIPLTFIFLVWITFFYGLTDNFGIEGDDMYIVSKILSDRHLAEPFNYLSIASSRHFLILSLIGLFQICNESPVSMQAVFFIFWLINSCLMFFLLRRFYSHRAALFGSIFFLVYCGKYEIVPVLSGGMYQVVISIGLIGLLVITNGAWSWLVRTLLFSTLLWFSYHLYEVLMPMAFVIPFYGWYLLYKKQIRPAGIFLSLTPCLVSILHIVLLSQSSAPIWTSRSGGNGIWMYVEALPKIFILSLDSTYGFRHWTTIRGSWYSLLYLHHLGGYFQILLGSVILVIILVSISLYIFWKKTDSSDAKIVSVKKPANIWLFFSCYLIFIAPLISAPVVIGQGFMASRFTYVPSIGLAFLVAYLISTYGSKSRLVILFFAVLIILEATAMRSILFQFNSSASYDDNLRKQIRDFHVEVKSGDTFFISLPENGLLFNVWRQGYSKFEQGGAQSLLMIDNPNLLFPDDSLVFEKRLFYRRSIRPMGMYTDSNFLEFLIPEAPNGKNLHAFILDSYGRLCGVNSVEIVGKTGETISKRSISNFSTLPDTCLISIKAPLTAISNDWIEDKRVITVYQLGGISQVLRIEAELFPNDPPLVAYLSLGDKLLSTFAINSVGRHYWDIQLPHTLIDQPIKYEIGNLLNGDNASRQIWKVQSLEILQ